MSSAHPGPSPALPEGLTGAAPPSRRRHRRGGGLGGPLGPPASPRPLQGAPPGGPQVADVFVTSRSDFRAQLRRCQKLLEPGGSPGAGGGPGGSRGSPRAPPGELRLHGLGLAVPRTINLALQLQAGAGGALRLHASTSSVPVRTPHRDPRGARRGPPGRGDREGGEWDDGRDGEGEDGDGEGGETPRHNSAIHIRLCREAPCA